MNWKKKQLLPQIILILYLFFFLKVLISEKSNFEMNLYICLSVYVLFFHSVLGEGGGVCLGFGILIFFLI